MNLTIGRFCCTAWLLISCGGFAQMGENDIERAASRASVEVSTTIVEDFGRALANRDAAGLRQLVASEGLAIYRGFTTGNLGSRGETLQAVFSPEAITVDLTLEVSGQTPIDLPWLFPAVAEAGAQPLPSYTLADIVIDLADPLGSLSRLQPSLNGRTEMVEGSPLVLWIDHDTRLLVEAQLIDGALVGGLAIFQAGRWVALWDLR